VPPISELAPDAWKEPIPLDDFRAKLRASRLAIKALLLDQNKVGPSEPSDCEHRVDGNEREFTLIDP
jgi:hypothetical protein